MKPVWIHGDARVELDDAIAFYESRACGLGLDLQKKVEDVVKRIQQSPEAWTPHKRSGCRCFGLLQNARRTPDGCRHAGLGGRGSSLDRLIVDWCLEGEWNLRVRCLNGTKKQLP